VELLVLKSKLGNLNLGIFDLEILIWDSGLAYCDLGILCFGFQIHCFHISAFNPRFIFHCFRFVVLILFSSTSTLWNHYSGYFGLNWKSETTIYMWYFPEHELQNRLLKTGHVLQDYCFYISTGESHVQVQLIIWNLKAGLSWNNSRLLFEEQK
jgi:hypothetical protein